MGNTHQNVANCLSALEHSCVCFSTADKVIAHTTVTFDISVLELFGSLRAGAQCILLSSGDARNPSAISDCVNAVGATVLQATPTLWGMLDRSRLDLRLSIVGGEALSEVAKANLSANSFNVYGPTEATIYTTFAEVDRHSVDAIGAPLANTQIHVLSSSLQAVAIGVLG